MTIDPRPLRRHRAADDLAAQKRPLHVHVHHCVERCLRVLLERTDLLGGGVGRRVETGVVHEHVRDAPLRGDVVDGPCDGRAVGDVDLVRADAVGHLAGCDVEARHVHASLGEPGEIDLAELSHPAGHDRDASLEVEQRVGHAASTARFAFQTASQSSRTQPYPPRRSRTSCASGTTSGQASAGHDRKTDGSRQLRVVDVVAEVRRLRERDAAPLDLLAQHGSLSATPWMHAASILRARADTTSFTSVERIEVLDADLVEPAQAERVAAPAGNALLAALVRPHAVVGEHAVEVEDDEANRGRAPSFACGDGLRGGLDVLHRDRLLDRQRPREAPPDQCVQLVRRQAAVGG